MRRPYTLEHYATLVDSVRRRLPDAAIGSDLIVGFPGESDEQAAILAAYLETSPLTHLHVFPYSDRPGTEAEALPGKVHGAVVKARAQQVRAVSRTLAARFRASQTGRVRPALTIEDGRTAVTDNYLRVPVPAGRARNEFVDVVVPPPDDAVPIG
jgi:threonylcarbamoyladenosine tRNA methylthiotransferase MtaB